MIDPARFVPADRRVDHFFSIIQAEQECVRVIEIVRHVLPQNAFAGVLDDPGAFGDRFAGVHSTTVHAWLANFDWSRWFLTFGFSQFFPGHNSLI